MNGYPDYINNEQAAQFHPSYRPSSQPSSHYSSAPSASSYQSSQSEAMSQSAYAYYQQQQGYGHAPTAQPNATPQMPMPYGYQPFANHPGHPSLPQPVNSVHPSQSGYIPTQQQAYTNYSTPSPTYPQAPSHLYPHYLEQGQGVPAPYDYQRHSPSSTVASSPSQSSQSLSSSDRFPCPNCDKSFTRNFDRKRHMEIHMPGTAGMNRCRYCHKDYSRPDSLKRHLDNGCEKKPRS